MGLSTWTGELTKGLGQTVEFKVKASKSGCGNPDCRREASAEVKADVYELSVERPDYLGLDLTDAMKGRDVTRTATAKIDPAPASATYKWTSCGRCKFIGRKDAADVTYGGNDQTGGSESYLAEPLTVTATAKNATGQEASATCTTNFTVVAVDIVLDGVDESGDETAIPSVYYVADVDGGKLSRTGIRCLKPVSFSCQPEGVPGSVDLSISSGAKLYEIIDGTTAIPTQGSYPCCEIGKRKFGVHGHSLSVLEKGELIKASHEPSGAVDFARVKVVPPPPIQVTNVKLISPAVDGGWPYDPIWDDQDWKATVNGSLAKDCAEDVDMAAVKYTLNCEASEVMIQMYQDTWGLGGDPIDGPVVGTGHPDVNTVDCWEITINTKTDDAYFATVSAIGAGDNGDCEADSDSEKIRRECYYYSTPDEVSDPLPSSGHVEVSFVTKADETIAKVEKVVANIAAVAAVGRLGGKRVAGLIESFIAANFGINVAVGSVAEVAVNAVAAIKGWFDIKDWEKANTKVVWYYWKVHRYDWIGGKYIKHEKDNPKYGDPLVEDAMRSINPWLGLPQKVQKFLPDIEMIVQRYYVAVPCENGQYKYLDLDSPTKSEYISTEKGGEGNEDTSKFRWEPTPYEGGYGLKCPKFSE